MARHRNLKDFLARTGTTQAQLAKRLGVKQPTVSRYLHGVHIPPLKQALRLAKLADIPVESLLGDRS